MMSFFSAYCPLHDSLIVTSNGPEFASILVELNSYNMLGVTSEASWEASAGGWVVPNADETEVVTGSNELAVLGEVYTVDVGTIDVSWVDTSLGPSISGSVGSPDSLNGRGGSTGVLLARWDGEKEKLMSTANSLDVGTVAAPID